MFLCLCQIYSPHNIRCSHRVVLLLCCCTVQTVSLGGYIHTYSFFGKSVQNNSRTPFAIAFILLNITDGYFSSFGDEVDFQKPEVFQSIIFRILLVIKLGNIFFK